MDTLPVLTDTQLDETRLRRRYQDIEDGIYDELHRILRTVWQENGRDATAGPATHDANLATR